ncbi:MAG TPA: phospholipase D-like domain-containing protein, partial [Chondromyces sp.]|nr:phospholipase D-like domain-containing protein [Chondromyces sp.]
MAGTPTLRGNSLELPIDNDISSVGSPNFDNRSFRLNFEITAVVAGQDFASQVERMLEADLAKSRLM